MNRSLMLLALLVGSVIGLGEAIAETASPSWAESVSDHWTGLVVAAHFPNELLHVFFFAGPFALALGSWRMRPVASRANA
jgi:hypothetical protein